MEKKNVKPMTEEKKKEIFNEILNKNERKNFTIGFISGLSFAGISMKLQEISTLPKMTIGDVLADGFAFLIVMLLVKKALRYYFSYKKNKLIKW